jgi:hypothetical protein
VGSPDSLIHVFLLFLGFVSAVRRWNAQAREVFDELPAGVWRPVGSVGLEFRCGIGVYVISLPQCARSGLPFDCSLLHELCGMCACVRFQLLSIQLMCLIGRSPELVQLLITTPNICNVS